MAVGFEQDNGAGTIKYNGTDYLAPTEKLALKNQPNGYPGLDNGLKIAGTQILYGNGANQAAQGNDSRLSDARSVKLGATIVVDAVYGNDGTGQRAGNPFQSIGAALGVALAGDAVLLAPGIYNVGNGITIPAGVAIRGVSLGSVRIQSQNVTNNVDLITMGENTRLEDVTLRLTSGGHFTLRGIVFPNTTAATAKVRTFVLLVDNSTAGDAGTSNVYGVDGAGTGQPDGSVQALRAGTITVATAGLGNKRGIYVGTASKFYMRDTNVVVKRTGVGAGSYIGIECNHVNGLISLREGYIDSPVTADMSQTLGKIIIGDTDLNNSTANGKGFSFDTYPFMFVWADDGAIPSQATRYMRPGTGNVSTNEIKIRMMNKAVVQVLELRALTAPGAGKTDTFTIRRNGIDTAMVITLSDAEVAKSLPNNSVTFLSGDDISVKVVSSNATATSDVVLTALVY